VHEVCFAVRWCTKCAPGAKAPFRAGTPRKIAAATFNKHAQTLPPHTACFVLRPQLLLAFFKKCAEFSPMGIAVR